MSDISISQDFVDYVNSFQNVSTLRHWAICHNYINNPHVIIRIRQLEIFSGLLSSFDVNQAWIDLIQTYTSKQDLLDFARKYNILQDGYIQKRIQDFEKVRFFPSFLLIFNIKGYVKCVKNIRSVCLIDNIYYFRLKKVLPALVFISVVMKIYILLNQLQDL